MSLSGTLRRLRLFVEMPLHCHKIYVLEGPTRIEFRSPIDSDHVALRNELLDATAVCVCEAVHGAPFYALQAQMGR